VQRNTGLSKNRFKIEITIETFGYSVKFNVRKKKKNKSMGYPFLGVILLRSWTWKKFCHTAMADSETN